ncbi:hypothetical protein N9149_03030 [Akkermansiaceae bacterium]|nr:hypothetical protein [Akkermansiaceae bacterium]
MAITFENAGKIFRAADQLFSPQAPVPIHETVHLSAYTRFNEALNSFSSARKEHFLEDDESSEAFIKPLNSLRRAFISTPLPMKILAKSFDVRIPPPIVPSVISQAGKELNDAFKELILEDEHPYEDSVSAAVGSLAEGIVRLVWKGWYQKRTALKVEERLREYENIYSGEVHLEIVTPREAANATEVADIQIVLGNLDYLESPPFERYRSISSVRASRLHLICLAPHAKVERLSRYLRLFEDVNFEAEFDLRENEPPLPVNTTDADPVFPLYSSESAASLRFPFNGDEGFVTRFEGPQKVERTKGRHAIRLTCAQQENFHRVLKAEECDIEELNLGDIVAIKRVGLRGEELSQQFSSDRQYQADTNLMESWKERWRSFDGTSRPWSLDRIKIKGGKVMSGLNEGHLKRWKRHGSLSAPRSNTVFRQLLSLLDYSENEIEKIISAKASLDNHHRQAGKKAASHFADKLRGKLLEGDIHKQHISVSLKIGDSSLEMTTFKIVDISIEIES